MIPTIVGITKLLSENIHQIGKVRAYAFGSASRPNTVPNDIDILIIYGKPGQPKIIRSLFSNLEYIPIHFTFLTVEEESETNFIMAQNCIQFYNNL